jgi:hypothetical protein
MYLRVRTIVLARLDGGADSTSPLSARRIIAERRGMSCVDAMTRSSEPSGRRPWPQRTASCRSAMKWRVLSLQLLALGAVDALTRVHAGEV